MFGLKITDEGHMSLLDF